MNILIYYLAILVSLGSAPDKKTGDDPPFTLQYKKVGAIELDLTVYPSAGKQQKAPAMIFFFGGGWKTGSIDQFKPHAQYFAQRGVTGILADYRVSSRHNTTPFDAVEDARDAVKFIIRNADRLGVDTNRMVISGGSAGGHLALMSAFLPKYESETKFKPAALVLFNPVIDTGPDGYGYKRIGDNYKAISPVDNIPQNPPPIIFFLGTDDDIIPVAQAKEFCHKAEDKGGICELKLYEDQKHGFFNYQHTEYFIDTVRKADQFLNQEKILNGKPTVEEWLQTYN